MEWISTKEKLPDDGQNVICAAKMVGDKCEWKQDENGVWETDCGNLFEITEGTPTENYLKFCPYCGKHLIQVDGESCGKEVHVAGSIQGVA